MPTDWISLGENIVYGLRAWRIPQKRLQCIWNVYTLIQHLISEKGLSLLPCIFRNYAKLDVKSLQAKSFFSLIYILWRPRVQQFISKLSEEVSHRHHLLRIVAMYCRICRTSSSEPEFSRKGHFSSFLSLLRSSLSTSWHLWKMTVCKVWECYRDHPVLSLIFNTVSEDFFHLNTTC